MQATTSSAPSQYYIRPNQNGKQTSTGAAIPEGKPPKKDGFPYYKLGTTFVAASTTPIAGATLVSILDKSMMLNAKGESTLQKAVREGMTRLIKHPGQYMTDPKTAVVLSVYFSTYMACGLASDVAEYKQSNPLMAKFFMGSMVNIWGNMLKDAYLAKALGGGTAKPMPLPSYLLLGITYSGTVGAGFSLPPLVSPLFQQMGLSKNKSDIAAQMLCPTLAQVPLSATYLGALSLQNNPKDSFASHFSRVNRQFLETVGARMLRNSIAFGICGLGFKHTQQWLNQRFQPPSLK